MMIKVLDSSKNFSTSKKKIKKSKPWGKNAKNGHFLYETICTNETNRFYLNHLVEEKH